MNYNINYGVYNMSNYNYSSDTPIKDSSEDAFNRYPFAKRVAQIISHRKDTNSIVIGIDGKWGEGKTSVFNLIESEFAEKENVVAIRFNPWRFEDENTMLLNFFAELVKALDRSIETPGEKFGEAVTKYVKPLAGLIGKGENVEAITDVLNSADIYDIKTRVESALEKERKRVVILIDDIDRLEKSEIHAVFRMVKLTADFKYTAYILAFDKEMVSAVLQERYGSENAESGNLFLDKIIQVPLQLPAIEGLDIKNFLYKAINDGLGSIEFEITNEEARLFSLYFEGFEPLLKTPRQVMLYSNIIMFSLPILKGEVNVVDLMLIEAIRVFIPELYELIRNSKQIFLSSLSSGSEKEEQANRKKAIEDKLHRYDEYSVEKIKSTLLYLFPRLNYVFNNKEYGPEREIEWENNQRICAEKYFQRYFSYSLSNRDFSDIKLNDMLLNLRDLSFEQCKSLINESFDGNNLDSFIAKLRRKVSSIDDNTILEKLAQSMGSLGNVYPHSQRLFDFNTPFVQAAMLISDIINKIDVQEKKLRIAIIIMADAEPLEFVLECFHWLSRESEESNKSEKSGQNVLNREELEQIGEALAKRILKIIPDRPELLFNNSKELLVICNKYGMSNEVRGAITSELTHNPQYAINLLNSFLHSTRGEEGTQNKADFIRDSYDALSQVVNVGDFINVLGVIFPNSHDDAWYPNGLDCTHDELITRQFLYINRHVKATETQED